MHTFRLQLRLLPFVLIWAATSLSAQTKLVPHKTLLDYGYVKIGLPADSALIVRNDGSSAVFIREYRIEGLNPTEFEVVGPPAGFSLLPLESVTLTVRAKPNANGIRRADLIIAASDGDLVVDLRSIGEERTATLEVRPIKLDFGRVAMFSDKSLPFTLYSTGTDPADINTYIVANYSGGEFFSAQPVDPAVTFMYRLQPGDSLEMIATFHGDGSLGERTGRVNFYGSFGGTPSVELTGEIARADMEIPQDEIDFGTVYLTEFSERTLTIKSTGEAPLQIDELGPLPNEFVLKNVSNLPLTVDREFNVEMRFTPTAVGDVNFAMPVVARSAQSGSLKFVVLKAHVLPLPLIADPTQTVEYPCASTAPIRRTITVRNQGGRKVGLSSISVSPIGTIIDPVLPDTVVSGDSRDYILEFRPSGNTDTLTQLVVSWLNDEGIVLQDTIHLLATATNIAVEAETTVESSTKLLGVKLLNPLTDLGTRSLRFELTPDDHSVIELETGAVRIDPGIVGATATARLENGVYVVEVTSPTDIIIADVSKPVFQIAVREFTTIAHSTDIAILARAPEKGTCLTFGSESARVIVASACGDSAIRSFFRGSTQISSIHLSENPARLNLEAKITAQETTELQWAIVSLGGATVLSGTWPVNAGENARLISLSTIAPAPYLLRISTNDEERSIPFVVIR
jgi:hypothetical protein